MRAMSMLRRRTHERTVKAISRVCAAISYWSSAVGCLSKLPRTTPRATPRRALVAWRDVGHHAKRRRHRDATPHATPGGNATRRDNATDARLSVGSATRRNAPVDELLHPHDAQPERRVHEPVEDVQVRRDRQAGGDFARGDVERDERVDCGGEGEADDEDDGEDVHEIVKDDGHHCPPGSRHRA